MNCNIFLRDNENGTNRAKIHIFSRTIYIETHELT